VDDPMAFTKYFWLSRARVSERQRKIRQEGQTEDERGPSLWGGEGSPRGTEAG